jgi:hypothetical protein
LLSPSRIITPQNACAFISRRRFWMESSSAILGATPTSTTTTTPTTTVVESEDNQPTKYCIPLQYIRLEDLPKVGGYVYNFTTNCDILFDSSQKLYAYIVTGKKLTHTCLLVYDSFSTYPLSLTPPCV